MNKFILKEVKDNLEQELENIGFDQSYRHKAINKFKYKNIKIFNLSIPQANILKQTAISVGADCAVHRETITSKVDNTDCLLGGSYSQHQKIAQKLKMQPFGLKKLAELIENELNFKLKPLETKFLTLNFEKPYIVGILNLTTDSFSDGGEFLDIDNAKKHLLEMINQGADIIDIGAETTKPFSSPTPAEIQLERILPILDFINENKIETPISIDTRSAEVAEKCILKGIDIINDVSGMTFDKEMINIIAKYKTNIIIQHSKGTPEDMQKNPHYENIIDEVFLDLNNKIENAISHGIDSNKIIIDVGIGFGKTREQNFELINRIEEFKSLKCPIMVGVSRKSLLNMQNESNEEKDIYTLALNSKLIENGVNFLRVHNVKIHTKLLKTQTFKH